MQAVITCILFGYATAATAAVTTFPYTNSFDGSGEVVGNVPTGDVWTATATKTTVASSPALGAKSCLINDAELTLNVNTPLNIGTNVRVRLFCKPVAYDTSSGTTYPTLDAGVRAAFIVNKADGKIHVYTGSGWGELPGSPVLPTDQSTWIGFLVTLDYSKNLWDLYYTNATGQVLAEAGFKNANTTPLSMANSGTKLSQVTVSSGISAWVDDFTVDRAYRALVGGSPSPANMRYMPSVVIRPGMAAREITRYFDSTSDGLAQECGAALGRALSADSNAKLHVHDPATGVSVYQYVAGAWGKVLGAGPAASGVRLTSTTGFWLETTISGTVAIEAFGPANSSTPSDVTLAADWNMLAWPWGTKRVNPPSNIGLPTTGKIFIYRPGSTYLELRYKSGLGWVSGSGTTASSAELNREQSIWYKATVGGDNWNIDSLGP